MVILAQLNPIKNLYFYAWYEMPNNFFQLRWSPPDSSLTDTLVGYNIYRDSVLYRFQTDTTMHHIDTWDTNAGEDFLYNNSCPFYIHVTAVYNSVHIESIYNDSAYCYGFAINIKEIQNNNIKLEILPNPVSDNSIITIHLDKIPNGEQLIIVNEQGIVIKGMLLVSRITKINISDLSIKNGLYFCRIIEKGQVITNKMIKLK